jgi:hypothetical protein
MDLDLSSAEEELKEVKHFNKTFSSRSSSSGNFLNKNQQRKQK